MRVCQDSGAVGIWGLTSSCQDYGTHYIYIYILEPLSVKHIIVWIHIEDQICRPNVQSNAINQPHVRPWQTMQAIFKPYLWLAVGNGVGFKGFSMSGLGSAPFLFHFV